MNRFRKHITAALEGLDAAAAAAMPVVAYDASACDAAMESLDASHREVEVVGDANDTMIDVAQSLESLVATLESLEQPLDCAGATFMNIAAESHLLQVGMDMSDAPLIASFENEEGAKQATKLSIDSIKAKLKAIWDAIVRVVKQVRDAVFGFVQNLIDANKHLEERAGALKASVAKAHGAAKASTFDDAGLAAKLHVGGKVDGIKHFADVGTLTDRILQVTEASREANVHNAELIGKVAASSNNEEVVNAVTEVAKKLEHVVPAAFPRKEQDGAVTLYKTDELPGGHVGQVRFSEGFSLNRGKGTLTHIPVPTFKMVAAGKSGATATLPTLSLGDITHVADGAIALGRENAKFKQMVENAEKTWQKIHANQEMAFAKAANDATAHVNYHAFLKVMGQLHTFSLRAAAEAARYVTQTARAYVAYGEKSLAQYGVKVEGGKDEGDQDDRNVMKHETVEPRDKASNESVELGLEGLPFFDKVKRLEKKLAKLKEDKEESEYFLKDYRKVLSQVERDGDKGDAVKHATKIAKLKEQIKELEADIADIENVIKLVEKDLEKARKAAK